MKIKGKISSYSNLIDFLNSVWKGLTLEPPTPPLLIENPKWWTGILQQSEIIVQKYINIIYNKIGAANSWVSIPTNKWPFSAISPAKWNFMGDRNYKKIHKWRFTITIMLTVSI